MDKGVYDGQLVLIDDIPKDASLSGEQPTTPLRETQMTNAVQDYEDANDEKGEAHGVDAQNDDEDSQSFVFQCPLSADSSISMFCTVWSYGHLHQ